MGNTKLALAQNESFTSNSNGDGTYLDPFKGTADGSTSYPKSITDYASSFDSYGAIIRGSGRADDDSVTPQLTTGTSWSFDGIKTTTVGTLSQKFNGAIWHDLGKTALYESNSQNLSTNLDGSWSKSDLTTSYKNSFDNKTSRPTSQAPDSVGTSLQFDGTTIGASLVQFGY